MISDNGTCAWMRWSPPNISAIDQRPFPAKVNKLKLIMVWWSYLYVTPALKLVFFFFVGLFASHLHNFLKLRVANEASCVVYKLQGYKVQLQDKPLNDVGSSFAVICGLTPGQKSEITIWAYSEAGEGPKATVHITTQVTSKLVIWLINKLMEIDKDSICEDKHKNKL